MKHISRSLRELDNVAQRTIIALYLASLEEQSRDMGRSSRKSRSHWSTEAKKCSKTRVIWSVFSIHPHLSIPFSYMTIVSGALAYISTTYQSVRLAYLSFPNGGVDRRRKQRNVADRNELRKSRLIESLAQIFYPAARILPDKICLWVGMLDLYRGIGNQVCYRSSLRTQRGS
jgi:hypothetical protein